MSVPHSLGGLVARPYKCSSALCRATRASFDCTEVPKVGCVEQHRRRFAHHSIQRFHNWHTVQEALLRTQVPNHSSLKHKRNLQCSSTNWRRQHSKDAQTRAFAAQDDQKRALAQFRYDLASGDTELLASYADRIRTLPLTGRDTIDLARQLHKSIWSGGLLSSKNQERRSELVQLLELYIRGDLPSHPATTSRLLSICRDLREENLGKEFWRLTEARGPDFVDASTYGSAISFILAFGADLNECERLYERALEISSSHGFSRYLMTPNAVLSQPGQRIFTEGTSTSLLAAIAHARFVHGDWHGAYTATDTIMKLYPDSVDPNALVMVLENRPYEEALRFYRLLCLSGNRITSYCFTQLIWKLRSMQVANRLSEKDALSSNFRAAIALIDIIHVAAATGQSLEPKHMYNILSGLLAILPPSQDLLEVSDQQKYKAYAENIKVALATISAHLGATLTSKRLTMIDAAGNLRKDEPFKPKLQSAQDDTQNNHEARHPLSFSTLQEVEKDTIDLIAKLNQAAGLISRSEIRDTSLIPMGVPSLASKTNVIPEKWQRRFYKEMHLDPLSLTDNSDQYTGYSSAPPPRNSRGIGHVSDLPRVARVGLDLEEVRFRNFEGLNDLMLLAEAWENHSTPRHLSGDLRSYCEDLEQVIQSRFDKFSEEECRTQILALRASSVT